MSENVSSDRPPVVPWNPCRIVSPLVLVTSPTVTTPHHRSPVFSVQVGVMAVSSSSIVPVPVSSEIVAFVAFDSNTVMVSLDSTVVSSVVATVIVCVVTPAAKVSVSEASV